MTTTRIDCGWLIAYVDGRHVIVRDGSVLIEDDRVRYAGPRTDAVADVHLDATDKIVAPGFVSTHNHLGASPFDRSFREDTSSQYFWQTGLYEFLTPIRGALTAEAVRASYRASCAEILHNGVTTAAELTGWAVPAAEVMGAFGIRAYVGPYLRSANWRVEGRRLVYDWLDDEQAERLYADVLSFLEAHADEDALVRGMFAPAQVDTCSPELMRRAAADAKRLGLPVQIHAAQSMTEFREMLERTGQTPIEFLADSGVMDENLIVGHAIFTAGSSWTEYPMGDDIGLLARTGASVAHCPQAFARYGIALESADRMRRAGVRLTIGTDTTPQSMLLELRLAAHLAKHVDRNAVAFGAAAAFTAATTAGADALGRPDLGRLAPGSKADLVIYRTDTPTTAPVRDPIKTIVYAALPSDVATVIIDGVTVLDDGVVVGVEETALARDMQAAADDVWNRVVEHSPTGASADDMAPLSAPLL